MNDTEINGSRAPVSTATRKLELTRLGRVGLGVVNINCTKFGLRLWITWEREDTPQLCNYSIRNYTMYVRSRVTSLKNRGKRWRSSPLDALSGVSIVFSRKKHEGTRTDFYNFLKVRMKKRRPAHQNNIFFHHEENYRKKMSCRMNSIRWPPWLMYEH